MAAVSLLRLPAPSPVQQLFPEPFRSERLDRNAMRTGTIYKIIFLTLFTCSAASAAQAEQGVPAELRGPVVGYVLDQNVKEIRPINGILGSSVLGEPLNLPFPVAAAAFSAQGDFALA